MPELNPERRVVEEEPNPYLEEGDQRLATSFNYVPTLMNGCPDDAKENAEDMQRYDDISEHHSESTVRIDPDNFTGVAATAQAY